MATQKKTLIDGILFNATGPTTVSLDKLYAWVVWQYPRLKSGGHSGAVHPPLADHGWFPAIIDPAKQQVLIFAHLPKPFESPEMAAKFLELNSA